MQKKIVAAHTELPKALMPLEFTWLDIGFYYGKLHKTRAFALSIYFFLIYGAPASQLESIPKETLSPTELIFKKAILFSKAKKQGQSFETSKAMQSKLKEFGANNWHIDNKVVPGSKLIIKILQKTIIFTVFSVNRSVIPVKEEFSLLKLEAASAYSEGLIILLASGPNYMPKLRKGGIRLTEVPSTYSVLPICLVF